MHERIKNNKTQSRYMCIFELKNRLRIKDPIPRVLYPKNKSKGV
jgi:hypothetical protein